MLLGGGFWLDDDMGWLIYDDFLIEIESIMVIGLEFDIGYQVVILYILVFGVLGDWCIIVILMIGVINVGVVGGLSCEQFEVFVEVV